MKRGDVFKVNWPYSDFTGSKERPAIVVQADFLNGLIDDTIFVQVTGTRHGLPGAEVPLDPATEPQAGLSKVCYASCTNILTLDQTLVVRRIGFVSDATMKQIEVCLKQILELP